MRVPESEGVKVAPVNPGAYQEYAAPNPDGREAKAWGEAANSAGGFGVSMLVSERAKAIKQADDLQFNMMVNEAEKANRRLTFDERDGYLSALGANALPDKDGVSLQDKMHEARKRSIDQILSGASNERVRRRFQKWDLENSSKFDAAVSKHVFEQYIKVQGDTFADRAQGATSDAITLASRGDISGALLAMDEVKAVTDQAAAMNGTKPDYQKVVGPALDAVIEAGISSGEDPEVLGMVFNNNEDMFAPSTRAATRKRLEAYRKDTVVKRTVDGIVDKHGGDYAAMLKAADSKSIPEEYRDEVLSKTTARIRVMEQERVMGEKKVEDACDEWQLKHPGEVPPRTMTEGASLAYRRQMEWLRQRLARGDGGGGGGGSGGSGGEVIAVGDGKGLVLPKGARAVYSALLDGLRRSNNPDERAAYAAMMADGKIHGLGAQLEGLPISAVVGPAAAIRMRNDLTTEGGINDKAIQALQSEAEPVVRVYYPKASDKEIKALASVIASKGEELDRAAGVGKVKDGKIGVSRFIAKAERDQFIKDELGTVRVDGWFGGSEVRLIDIDRDRQKVAAAIAAGKTGVEPKYKKIRNYGKYVAQGYAVAVLKGKSEPEGTVNRVIYDWNKKQAAKGHLNPELNDEQKKAVGGMQTGVQDPDLVAAATLRIQQRFKVKQKNGEIPAKARLEIGPKDVQAEIIRHAFPN